MMYGVQSYGGQSLVSKKSVDAAVRRAFPSAAQCCRRYEGRRPAALLSSKKRGQAAHVQDMGHVSKRATKRAARADNPDLLQARCDAGPRPQ